MPRNSEGAIFWLTAASAAASVVSIAAMEILLAAALLLWLLTRRTPLNIPSYFVPLCVFFLTTLVSLALSPDPGAGRHAIQKFVLVSMGLLAAAFVTSDSRAEKAYKLLLATTVVSAGVAIVQFAISETRFLETGELVDDPTLVNRITGPLGHWMTFSGVQLLVFLCRDTRRCHPRTEVDLARSSSPELRSFSATHAGRGLELSRGLDSSHGRYRDASFLSLLFLLLSSRQQHRQ
jgi:hypothetical protein